MNDGAPVRKKGFRQSMTWLHTWSGLIVGWVLYFVFVTGTLGYFYVEIDRWMRPEQPLRTHTLLPSAWLAKAEAYLRGAAPNADRWTVHLPGGRPEGSNYADIRWRRAADGAGARAVDRRLLFDPESNAFREVSARLTGGGHLLYRMHWQLHYMPRSTGPLIVGVCSMIMLVVLVTGVISHRRIFVDLFTFRPGAGARSWLDAHTVASVLALPFFLMITYSGLVFFADIYMPITAVLLEEVVDVRRAAEEGGDVELQAGHAWGSLLPLDYFRTAAVRYWGDDRVRTIEVYSPGGTSPEVHLVHNGKGILLRDVGEELHFSGIDGRLIRQETARGSAARRAQSTLFGLHEGIFADNVLRWLYFLSGLVGCVMVASGLLLWTTKRKRKAHSRNPWGFGHTLVGHLNIGTIAGLPMGIAVYFWANRVLPASWPDRAAWEVHSMFIAWGLMLLYPTIRPHRRAWVEELAIASAAFTLLPMVNALTTDRHLGVTIPAGDWALAGFDLTVLGLGIVLAVAALKVHKRSRNAATVRHERVLVANVASEVG